tara:strand:+ start:2561 stop:2980 length:420 start_codon:yes stop_codon:yes gene_type:complete
MLNADLSLSPEFLQEITGNNNTIIYDTKMDMLVNQPTGWDMIITNIPFSTKLKQTILRKLVEYDKPFIIIMNSMNLFSNYMRDIFKGNFQHLQVITPRGKINYTKLEDDGSLTETSNCSFYCCYLCYKLNINNEDLWLE